MAGDGQQKPCEFAEDPQWCSTRSGTSMDLINTLSGEGTVTAKARKTHVDYELKVYQHWLTVGSDKNVPGLTEVHGWIRPVFGKDREMLTLEMNDESSLRFCFADRAGNITANGGIVPLA
jgi:hypothetical protein